MKGHKIYITRDRRFLGSPEAWRLIKRAVRAALDVEGIDAPCEMFVLLTDDEGIRAINLENRGIDAPTDVLSFPMNESLPGQFDASKAERDMDTGLVLLGDMVVSLERARAQGEEYGHGFAREISYLTVHSVLHLLGYDHMDEGPMKKQMRLREKAVMSTLGPEDWND